MTRRGLVMLLAVIASVLGLTVPAAAVDAVLYEVTEAVKVTSDQGSEVSGGQFKASNATLAGGIASGTALCPTWLTTQLNMRACSIVVRAIGRGDDVTGIGPANGQFEIVVQDANTVDAPEITVMNGTLRGTIDMSPAFQGQRPLGAITGGFSATGVAGTIMQGTTVTGRFTGTFRLPFRHVGKPSYLMDDGSIVPVGPGEHSLGWPTVRLEVVFTP